MEFCPNFISVDDDPAQWARDREAEGYPIISVADHISSPQPHPHVWVTATTFALATERIRVMIAFGNNLVRSPVEFARRVASYSEDDLRARVEMAREVAPDMPLGFLALVGAGPDPALREQGGHLGEVCSAGSM